MLSNIGLYFDENEFYIPEKLLNRIVSSIKYLESLLLEIEVGSLFT